MTSDEDTVVAEYTPVPKTATTYQSEAELEKEFIHMLEQQGYEYLPIHKEEDLKNNLRDRLSELNNYNFTDNEWERFFKKEIALQNTPFEENPVLLKTEIVQNEVGQFPERLECDDGTKRNIYLIDKKNIYNNKLQVINQYEVSKAEGAKQNNRYDVTILLNGLPIVHIELKKRGSEEGVTWRV